MNPRVVDLHQFEPGQGIADSGLARLRAQRLHLFPGRALGEDEFDRMQAWGDARIAGLESSLTQPGILYGLQCRLHDDDGDKVIEVLPGEGLGRGGELHRLSTSLHKEWIRLRQGYRAREDTADAALNGLYLVLLDAVWFHVDLAPNQRPCSRNELDRLRDARLERGLILGLEGLPASLWDIDEIAQQPLRAANRLLGELLHDPERMPLFDGVALAVVGVRDDALLWLDAPAGAFASKQDALHERLRAHLYHAFKSGIQDALRAEGTPLEGVEAFRPVYLPAAAELPVFLLEHPAGVNPLPRLQWFPGAARQELQVLPESSLQVVMAANLRRPATAFNDLMGDRYRIGVVLPDTVYRDGLLQLPRIDPDLVDLVRLQARLAHNAVVASQIAWDVLAVGFAADASEDIEVPVRPVDAEQAETVLDELAGRIWQAKSAGATLEAPYSSDWPALQIELPASDSADTDPPDGLLVEYAEEQAKHESLIEMMADLDELLDYLDQEKKQQRSLVDTMTIDLAQLAGGVAGDGSGLKVAKAARSVELTKP